MTHVDIEARNRANALKSTGPRTAEGKAIVSRNAVRHGATSRPDPESVAAWLSIILDSPEVSVDALMPGDDRGFRALALAQAEVRLVAAERALVEFEAGQSEPPEDIQDLRMLAEEIRTEIDYGDVTRRELRAALSLLSRVARAETQETQPGGKHHRLLKRYVREARAQRRRAFLQWLEFLDAEVGTGLEAA